MIKYNPNELSGNNEKKKFELLPEGDLIQIVVKNILDSHVLLEQMLSKIIKTERYLIILTH